MTHIRYDQNGFTVDTDPARIDLDVVHGFLRTAYWSRKIPREVVARSIAHSLNFGLYGPQGQVGFARLVTDRATFAYLGDVFVLPEYRGQGLGKWLMTCVLEHPELQGLRRWHLVTGDAHDLYRQHGFVPLSAPDWHMERFTPDTYGAGDES